ncbi:unnamed protein product [marine sediment metagenome]|uniref:Uncharacterized protein n=1 Tax=marine sediment metagenome TaxID=412755 RepID=X1R3C4_9ZZZZ
MPDKTITIICIIPIVKNFLFLRKIDDGTVTNVENIRVMHNKWPISM